MVNFIVPDGGDWSREEARGVVRGLLSQFPGQFLLLGLCGHCFRGHFALHPALPNLFTFLNV